MRKSLLKRRILLKLGGAGLVGGMMTTSPAVADEAGEEETTGGINNLSGFETPLPITENSHRLQLISPANRLTIDAETDDVIDLVFEWDESVTVTTENGGRSISGSGVLNDEEDIGEHRAIFRGEASDSNAIVYDRLTLRGLDTSGVEPGDEVEITVSARQADSAEDIDDFDDVVTAVDDGSFDAEATTEATFEVTQGTLISTNDEATTSLELAESVDHTIGFDIDQLRDEDAEGTPAGPAKGIIINYDIDDDDGLEFDLADDDVTLGGAAADLDLEVVKEREIPGIGQVLLEIANEETLENDADLEFGDTVTVELSGLDTAAIDPDEFDEAGSIVEVGLHGAATFDPIVEKSITPDRGAYTIDSVDFEFGDQNGPTEIEDWHDLDEVRDELDGNYVLKNDLDGQTDGYDSLVDTEDGFEPIGIKADNFENDRPFTGTFDGQDNVIDGLIINRPDEDGVGLFGLIGDGAAITNIGLENASVSGNEDVGILAGTNDFGDEVISHVHVMGDVSGDVDVGGIVGYLSEGTIEHSYSAADVSGNTQIGGLAGFTGQNSVHDCYSTGTVTGEERRIGGLIGFTGGTHVEECYSSSDVTTETADQVGGLIGLNAGIISVSYATGTVTGYSYVGGLVGSHEADEINTSFANTTVEATGDDAEVGGFVGAVDGDHTITESYALGSIEAENASSLGGFVGESKGEITDSYTAVEVNGTGTDVGAFVGRLEGAEPVDSYWDADVSGQDDDSDAVARSTDEMIGEAAVDNMTALDFEEVWKTKTDPDEYPTLRAIVSDDPVANFVVSIVEPSDGAEVREDESLKVTVEITNEADKVELLDVALTEPIEDVKTDIEVLGGAETDIVFSIPEEDVEGTFEIRVGSDDTSDSVSVTAVDPCFIATAAYNTPQADEIDVLRDFRDNVLKKHAVGRLFTKMYYTTSPPIANWIRRSQQRRQVVRKYFVEPLVTTVDRLTGRFD